MNEERKYVYYELTHCLRFLKFLNDIGIYENAVGNIERISVDDYYELALRGLEHVAPEFYAEELGEDFCCGGHTAYHFSGPAIAEFYRLCRLYEYKHGVAPDDNPHVRRADKALSSFYMQIGGNFGIGYNDDVHIRELIIEICPEHPYDEMEIIWLVRRTLEYYRNELETLQAELQNGPAVWLPALPPHKKQIKTKMPRKKAEKPLKKAS